MTDTAATRPYGVLGRVLDHSYTPTIYKELAGLEYVRFEREPEGLEAFMTGDEWEGTNVTIPYKRAVIAYLTVACAATTPTTLVFGAWSRSWV